jgi:CheY-like chemotaxis protein
MKYTNIPLQVMIVDDDPDALYTLMKLCSPANVKPYLLRMDMNVLSYLKKKIPDVILLDIMMPGMDGFQTLKKISAMDQMEIFRFMQ